MSFLQKLKEIYFPKSKSFHVNYKVVLVNISSDKVKTNLVIPIPPNLSYQKIDPVFDISPEKYTQGKEPKYGNHYIWWEVELGSNETKTYSLSFSAQVSYPSLNLKPDFLITDYQKIDPVYLESNEYINPNHPQIKTLLGTITQGESALIKVIQKLNAYVVSQLSYGDPITGLYKLEDVLIKDKVDCGGFDVLLCSLCRAAGIPCTIVSGFWAGYTPNNMHAWVLIQLPDNHWVVADPSIEYLRKHGRSKKSGRLFKIGNDRIALSLGEKLCLSIDGSDQVVGILQNPLLFPSNSAIEVISEFQTR